MEYNPEGVNFNENAQIPSQNMCWASYNLRQLKFSERYTKSFIFINSELNYYLKAKLRNTESIKSQNVQMILLKIIAFDFNE